MPKTQSRQYQKTKMRAVNGWVAFMDIYGFKGHLNPANIRKTVDDLYNIHIELENILKLSNFDTGHNDFNYHIFSDSAVIWVQAEDNDIGAFHKLAEFCVILTRTAAEHGYLYRGCSAYGSMTITRNFVLGAPYLRAYEMEAHAIKRANVIVPESELKAAGISVHFSDMIKTIKFKNDTKGRALILDDIPKSRRRQIKVRNLSMLSHELSNEDDPKKIELIKQMINGWRRQ